MSEDRTAVAVNVLETAAKQFAASPSPDTSKRLQIAARAFVDLSAGSSSAPAKIAPPTKAAPPAPVAAPAPSEAPKPEKKGLFSKKKPAKK